MNSFIVNYDTKTVELTFNEEKFTFDLSKGGVGDFWGSFIDKEEFTNDVNFCQENKDEQPCFSIYGLTIDPINPAFLIINMNDETVIDCAGQIGNPDNYFE